MKKVLYVVLAVVLVLGGGGALLAKPADAATPADPLYSVDKLYEALQMLTTLDPVAKTELAQAILDERAAELTTIVENADLATDENIEAAVLAVEDQTTRVQERIQDLEDREGLEEGALEQVQNRYEKQVQTHTATMTQVKNTVKNMGEDTQLKIEEAVGTMQGEGNGSSSSGNSSEDSGSGSSNTDSGSSSSGSSSSGSNSSSTNGNSGSSGGNGNN